MAWLASWWNTVSETAFRGLEITVVGMALVFFTLGLVILAMVLLTRLPWLRIKQPPTTAVLATPERVESAAPPPTQEHDLARIAAIAVATLHSRRRASPRQYAQAKRGTWKSYGRAHQLGL